MTKRTECSRSLTTVAPTHSDVSLLSHHAKSPRSRLPRLYQMHLGTQSFTFQPDLPYVIGSGKNANIELADPSIPQRAATIMNDQLIVHEGVVQLNGRHVPPSTQGVTIRDGDALKIGSALIKMVELSAEASAHQNLRLREQALPLPSSSGTATYEHPHSAAIRQLSPSNSELLKSRVQDKEDGSIERQRYAGGGLPYGTQGFHDSDLEKISPSPKRMEHTVQPGHSASLATGGLVTAGSQPVHVQENIVSHNAPSPHARPVAGAAAVGGALGAIAGLQSIPIQDQAQRPVAIIPASHSVAASGNTGVKSTVVSHDLRPFPGLENTALAQPTMAQQPVMEPLGKSVTHNLPEQAGARFLNTELVQIFRDMCELGGQRLTLEADAALPGMIVMFPHHLRSTMGSRELKKWIRASDQERMIRAAQPEPASATHVKQIYLHPKDQLTETDLAYGMLTVVGEEESGLQSSALGTGVASSTSTVTDPRFGNTELSDILIDMIDVSGDRLEPGVHDRIPIMLNHLPRNYRASFDSKQLKLWIKSAHELKKERSVWNTGVQAPAQSSNDRTLSDLDLVYSLVGLPWYTERPLERKL